MGCCSILVNNWITKHKSLDKPSWITSAHIQFVHIAGNCVQVWVTDSINAGWWPESANWWQTRRLHALGQALHGLWTSWPHTDVANGSPCLNTTKPFTIVMSTLPYSCVPVYGESLHLCCSLSLLVSVRASGSHTCHKEAVSHSSALTAVGICEFYDYHISCCCLLFCFSRHDWMTLDIMKILMLSLFFKCM